MKLRQGPSYDRWSLKETSLQGFHKIHLLSDALQVVLAINGLSDWSIHPILLDIKGLSTELEDISFPRPLNSFTHKLAMNSYGLDNFMGLEGGLFSY